MVGILDGRTAAAAKGIKYVQPRLTAQPLAWALETLEDGAPRVHPIMPQWSVDLAAREEHTQRVSGWMEIYYSADQADTIRALVALEGR